MRIGEEENWVLLSFDAKKPLIFYYGMGQAIFLKCNLQLCQNWKWHFESSIIKQVSPGPAPERTISIESNGDFEKLRKLAVNTLASPANIRSIQCSICSSLWDHKDLLPLILCENCLCSFHEPCIIQWFEVSNCGKSIRVFSSLSGLCPCCDRNLTLVGGA
jgi:hypothetical protein